MEPDRESAESRQPNSHYFPGELIQESRREARRRFFQRCHQAGFHYEWSPGQGDEPLPGLASASC